MSTRRMRAVKILAVALFAWCTRVFRRRDDRRRPALHLARGGPYGHIAAWRRRDAARRLHVLRLPVRRGSTPDDGNA